MCNTEIGYIDRCEQVRLNYEVPLKAGKDRQIRIHVASGLSLHATTRYCAPLRKEGLDDEVPGLDIELSLFGFSGGGSWAWRDGSQSHVF